MSRLAEIAYPIDNLEVTCKVEGILAYPDEWKALDESNPGLFGYLVRWGKFEFEKGKIYPRELTPQQLKQQEEKNKKAPKKEAKKQEPSPEEEALRLQEEEAEKLKKDQWAKMTQQQRFHSQSEDPFKSALLKFQTNSKSHQYKGKQLVVLEERVFSDKGDWLYVFRYPVVSQEELAKLRKAKPKTLPNINDLNPVVMRAWLDLGKLQSSDCRSVKLRCSLSQVDRAADTPEPNLSKIYVKVSIQLSKSLVPQKDTNKLESILLRPPATPQVPASVKCVEEFKEELKFAIQSIAMEYSTMFWKDMNVYEEQRMNQIFVINRKNDIPKRREHFLYDFNVSGKYKILKDRIKRCIVQLCEHKYSDVMAGAKSWTGVSYNAKDQFYSQIYDFLVSSYKQCISELVKEKVELGGHVDILSQAAQKSLVDACLELFHETIETNPTTRLAAEYDAVGQSDYCKAIYESVLKKTPNDIYSKHSYVMFCLTQGLLSVEEAIAESELYYETQYKEKELLYEYMTLLLCSSNHEHHKKCWLLLRELLSSEPGDIDLVTLANVLFAFKLNEPNLSLKYSHLSNRMILKQLNTIPPSGSHKTSPAASEVPTLTEPEETAKQAPYLKLLQIAMKFRQYKLAAKVKTLIANSTHIALRLVDVFSQADPLPELQALYNQTQNSEVLNMLVRMLLKKGQFKKQSIMKLIMKLMQLDPANSLNLLRLGFYYFKRGEYANSKVCLTRYLAQNPKNSGLSWRMLGICENKLQNYDSAVQCLRRSNYCDPDNSETWLHLAWAYHSQSKKAMTNQCFNEFSRLLNERKNAETDNEIFTKLRTALA